MTNSSHETSNIERQRGSVMRFIDSRCERTNQANDQICRLGILETVSATLTRLKAALPRKPYEAELRGPVYFIFTSLAVKGSGKGKVGKNHN
ncbi:hypothetical protein D917_09004 [Trichinella nativa]|uniref:Uncharacterized protein n=1 Tax=Trichinella nativa TaxID=6335 RepID=A0A1Y3ELX0_9BILA|nr:hypothetical protein D917_09004 [Trichinella nativa]